ncbi:MAG: UDP-N-acetylmuramoyl-L-alanyl-D-glutamate--2,6-diaminopimelate ligase, partial [Acidimicrobiia bacterium]|nr:UDP-N-acetylmuramoyl-L-alanyl-D-glutamate--2,6-diaminopimelate ligase [Acidimicrobiia bacterium]
RRVDSGDLFICVPGGTTDGHDHAPVAVESGAVALAVERALDIDVPQFVVADARRAAPWLATAFHGQPSRNVRVVGITGTNGKTTSVHLLDDVLRSAGVSAASIGTLTGARTTPEATELQLLLAELSSIVDVVVMEVSSHALAQHRVDGVWFEVTAFTNLSLDHLDFHADFEEYFEAKASLFTPARSDIAVIDVGSPAGRRLAERVATEVIEVSIDDVDDLQLSANSSSFRWKGHHIELPLLGRFNVSNALVVAACAELLGLTPEQIAVGLGDARPVPGRVEVVDEGQAFTVIVDYAHTPDGLAKVLAAARELADGRVIVVFGCGGDRDKTKRPEMGSIAGDLADMVVVTTDNSRHEHPDVIIEEVVAGIDRTDTDLRVEPDRRAAIELAVGVAVDGDIVVVAGKGHETTQTIGDTVMDFDDRVVARRALAAIGGRDR